MWGDLLIESLASPRAAARRLLALPLPPAAVAGAGVAVVCLGVVLGYAALSLAGNRIDPITRAALAAPLAGALVQLAVLAGIVWLTWWLGARFGGRGDLLGAAKTVVWLNVVTLAAQAVQLAALALSPPLAQAIALASLLWLFWAFANFTAELHDFTSPFIVLGVAVLTAVGLAIGFMSLASLLGFTFEGAP